MTTSPKQLKVSHIGRDSVTVLTDDKGVEYVLPFDEWMVLTLPLILPRYREGHNLTAPEDFEAVREKWAKEQERAERDFEARAAQWDKP